MYWLVYFYIILLVSLQFLHEAECAYITTHLTGKGPFSDEEFVGKARRPHRLVGPLPKIHFSSDEVWKSKCRAKNKKVLNEMNYAMEMSNHKCDEKSDFRGSNNSGGGGGGSSNSGDSKNDEKDAKCDVKLDPVRLNNLSIAIQAAKDAKEAVNAQGLAAAEASRKAKTLYAERAVNAAKEAQGALASKEHILETLNDELKEAESIVAEETANLDSASTMVQYGVQAAQEANEQIGNIKNAIQTALTTLENCEKAHAALQSLYENRIQLVEAAKKRSEMLLTDLTNARVEYGKTRKAAYHAACAAKQAADNVDRQRRHALHAHQKK